jgi:membrane protein YdbS with pleckstrin-like domain
MLRVIHAGTAAMRQRPLLVRSVILFGAVVLVAGHGAFLYYVRAHVRLSVEAFAGLILLVLVKHLGLLTPAFARFRRRTGAGTEGKVSNP